MTTIVSVPSRLRWLVWCNATVLEGSTHAYEACSALVLAEGESIIIEEDGFHDCFCWWYDRAGTKSVWIEAIERRWPASGICAVNCFNDGEESWAPPPWFYCFRGTGGPFELVWRDLESGSYGRRISWDGAQGALRVFIVDVFLWGKLGRRTNSEALNGNV